MLIVDRDRLSMTVMTVFKAVSGEEYELDIRVSRGITGQCVPGGEGLMSMRNLRGFLTCFGGVLQSSPIGASLSLPDDIDCCILDNTWHSCEN